MRRAIIVTTLITSLITLIALSISASSGRVPWQRRIGRNVEIQHKLQHQRVLRDMWPEEPKTPHPIDSSRFTQSMMTLCNTLTETRGSEFAAAIIEESVRFDIDPFLVGALMYDQSRCLPKQQSGQVRAGLSRLDVAMHAPHIRRGVYRYWIREAGQWHEQTLVVDVYPFNHWRAAAWRSNIYWTSAILAVFSRQAVDLADAFPTKPYRHYVSHWFFGDNVQEIEPEDRVLTARRRLLQYYHGAPTDAVIGDVNGIPIVSPLDGVPRLVLDDYGNPRGMKRGLGHQGMDLVAANGEPVRAMADGRVVFAGADLPGTSGSQMLTIAESATFDRRRMGKGGLYIIVNHRSGFRTVYMHLDSIAVEERTEVRAGDLIGTAGRTGARESGNHLHLEFRLGQNRLDPALYMTSAVVDPIRATATR